MASTGRDADSSSAGPPFFSEWSPIAFVQRQGSCSVSPRTPMIRRVGSATLAAWCCCPRASCTLGLPRLPSGAHNIAGRSAVSASAGVHDCTSEFRARALARHGTDSRDASALKSPRGLNLCFVPGDRDPTRSLADTAAALPAELSDSARSFVCCVCLLLALCRSQSGGQISTGLAIGPAPAAIRRLLV